MTRLLIKKFLRESILLWACCATLVFMFCYARVWIVCQFDLQQFEPLLKQLKAFERFIPFPLEQALTYTGNIALTLHEPMLIVSILVWSIARGSDVVSGELGRGTMEILLSHPISRQQLLATHSLLSAVGLSLLCALSWLGFYTAIHTCTVTETIAPTVQFKVPFLPVNIPVQTGVPTEVQVPLSSKVDAQDLLLGCFNLFTFGFVVLAVSVFFSSCDRFRWRTLGITIGFYICQVLAMVLSRATEQTTGFAYVTFLTLYRPDETVMAAQRFPGESWRLLSSPELAASVWASEISPLGNSCILLAIGAALLVAAGLIFQRRDLAAPV